MSIMNNFNNSLLIKFFREFHQTVLVQKAVALTGRNIHIAEEGHSSDKSNQTASAPIDSHPIDPPSSPQSLSDKIQMNFMDLFRRQMDFAVKQGGEFVASYYQEAQYIMVAYLDEVFLNMEWCDQRLWETNLMESRIFNSHIAGESFFTRLDAYLQQRDPATRDLGAIFLWTLGLGFKGMYRNEKDESPLRTYKRKLYGFITGETPRYHTPGYKMIAAPYQQTITENYRMRLPNPHIYKLACWGVVLLFFVMSFFVWLKETHHLRHTVNEIIKLETQDKPEA